MSDAPLRATLLTPAGRGAIAAVSVQGPGALATVARIFISASQRELRPGNRIYFGRWQSAAGEELIVTVRGDDHVEIHCHGGNAAASAILDSLQAAGCLITSWQSEACQEPFSIGGEARLALASATTERGALHLLDQYNGALLASLHELRRSIQQSDFAVATKAVECLIERGQLGLHLGRPWRVVIAGRPNVGKSSLINALLGYERAIVFDTPGTTRDIVSAQAALDGWPVEFFDTAGLRDSTDAIEQAGVSKARSQITRSDLTILVFDVSQPWSDKDEELLALSPEALRVFNKSDLPPQLSDRPPGVLLSAVTGEGLGDLQAAIVRRLIPATPRHGAAIPFTERQLELLSAAHEQLRSNDAQAALATVERIDPALSGGVASIA
jgi:tRNA modification GTPase